MNPSHAISQARTASQRSATLFFGDVGRGLRAVSHSTFAGVGVAAIILVSAAGYAGSHDQTRSSVEQFALQWLQDRHEVRTLASGDVLSLVADPDAVKRATATDITALPSPQARLAQWIARRYKVAPEPIGALVQEAWDIGKRVGVEPTLVLAIMAIESSFNPFAQSPVGAQGLMQVMTRVHDDKYESFGGIRAAFDPISNLRVGVQVLRDCINRAGSVEEGLRHYVGAALLPNDGGYAARVLGEQAHMLQVVAGQRVPFNVRNQPAPLREAAADPPAAADTGNAPPQVVDPKVTTLSKASLLPSLPLSVGPRTPAGTEQVALLR